MKRSLSAVALALSTSIANAHYAPCNPPSAASDSLPSNALGSNSTAPGVAKTRAQVMAELYEARRLGLAPSGRQDWPPTEQSIRRNKARYAASQRWHETHPCN
ncbi:hypothetical protein AWB81_05047 [Caballeronia arationis]|uniref:DUF4148 domain-containing protein n=1 Tax=Caballeronia arationis TaxID=1777142 RepID=UPI00074CCF38|nr:hypothetical protein AWB81_05047 [Caballeronia arationis]